MSDNRPVSFSLRALIHTVDDEDNICGGLAFKINVDEKKS